MRPQLLTRAASLINEAEPALNQHGLDSQIELSPPDRDPGSISWIVEGGSRMSQMVLWEDGQSEIDLAEVESGRVTSEHRRVDNDVALVELVDSVRSWLLAV